MIAPRDRITLAGIEVWAHHGVLDHEVEQGQPFRIDIAVETDLEAASLTDDLDETVDYRWLADAVTTAATGGPYRIIERVAGAVAEALLEHPRVAAVEVTVHKPRAPLPVSLADVSVTLRRERRT